MMIALFDNTTSADSTMDAITEMRGIVKETGIYQWYERCRYRY